MNVSRVMIMGGITGLISLCACQEETVCTAEFRFVNIRVLGDTLTDYYTVRITNSDTIRYDNPRPDNSTSYVVLDDSYQPTLANTQDQFRFIGLVNNVVVVNEEFIIKADKCHISKVSGREEVQL